MEMYLVNISKSHWKRTFPTARKCHHKINVSEVRGVFSLLLSTLFPPFTQSNRGSLVGEGSGGTVREIKESYLGDRL